MQVGADGAPALRAILPRGIDKTLVKRRFER
jgi:hypothetical protein